jgi:formylglycine-generating enzyme required for sulfatase activity
MSIRENSNIVERSRQQTTSIKENLSVLIQTCRQVGFTKCMVQFTGGFPMVARHPHSKKRTASEAKAFALFLTVLIGLSLVFGAAMIGTAQTLRDSGMVLVTGGTFTMGNNHGYVMERPEHRITLHSFFIDKTEVTVRMYTQFCSATGTAMPSAPPWGWSEDNPMVNVSWQEAAAYATWIGRRLPTEAEWEYAARGGLSQSTTAFSGGDELDKVAWYEDNAKKRTQDVAKKAPNALGIFDLTGNAAEWCNDYYSGNYYATSPGEDPQGPEHGRVRVVRGGSFRSDSDDCHISRRRDRIPVRRGFNVGFRCAADAKEQ